MLNGFVLGCDDVSVNSLRYRDKLQDASKQQEGDVLVHENGKGVNEREVRIYIGSLRIMSIKIA